MDTDSNYIAITGDQLEDIVRTEFKAKKKDWVSWKNWSEYTPGLFKLECEGSRMVELCSRCNFFDKQDGEKMVSTKGMFKRQSNITWLTWQRFKAALNGSTD